MPIVITRLLPPDEWRGKQIAALKAVGEANYRTRVQIPKKSPIKAGIAAEARYASEMRKVLDEKRRKKGLSVVTDDEWLGYTLAIGAPRLVEGVTKREPKVKKFIDAWHPMLREHLSKVDPMATTTLKDRVNKAVANMEGLAALHGAWKGGRSSSPSAA